MIKIILLIIIAICVTVIYDARRIGERYFSSSMKNKQINMLKIFGFIIGIICAVMLCILIN